MVQTPGQPNDEGWGSYNEYGIKEVGNSKDRSISDELDRLVHNFGLEYWYGKYFAIRTSSNSEIFPVPIFQSKVVDQTI